MPIVAAATALTAALVIALVLLFGSIDAVSNPPCGDASAIGGSCGNYPFPKVYPIIGTPQDHAARPLGNWQSDHAVDIGAPRGTAVLAVEDGQITKAGGAPPAEGAGKIAGFSATLRTSGDAYFYTHLLSISVKAGDKVKQGDLIGKSGWANGVDHLHIGVEKANPMTLWGEAKKCDASGALDASWEDAVRAYSGSNYGVSHLQNLYKGAPQQGRVGGDRAIVKAAAQKYGIPFELLWATYGAESSWGKAASYFGLTGDYPGSGTSGSFKKDAERSAQIWKRLRKENGGVRTTSSVQPAPKSQLMKIETLNGPPQLVRISTASPISTLMRLAPEEGSPKPATTDDVSSHSSMTSVATHSAKAKKAKKAKEAKPVELEAGVGGLPPNLLPLGNAPLPGARRGIATVYFPSQGGINGNEGAGAYAQVYEKGWGAARLGSAGGGVRNAWGLTVVKVTNTKSSKTVYVPIIDNGPGGSPIGGKPRIIDLLPPVSKALNNGKADNLDVVIEPVGRISVAEANKYGRGDQTMGEGSPAIGEADCPDEGSGDGTISLPPGIDVTSLTQVQGGERYTTNSGTFTIPAEYAKDLFWWQKNNVPIPKWMAGGLLWARKNGWDGVLSNGFRTNAHQRVLASGSCPNGCAAPGTSNHEGAAYPRGAVDTGNGLALRNILKRYPGRPKIIWGPDGSNNDDVHFSHNGG